MKIILFVYLLAALAFTQDEKPLIEVQSSVDTSVITIGDRIRYSVSIDHKKGMRVEKPGAGVNLGQFEIKNYRVQEPYEEDGRIHIRYEYVISVFDTGKFTIPPFPVAYFPTDSTSDYRIIEANPINIYVESVLLDESKELKDIKPPVYIPFDYFVLISIALVVIGLIVAGFFGYRFYKRRKESGYLFKPPEPPKPAHIVALAALDELKRKDLLASGEIKQFYIEVSEIIRRYIEGRFFIPALEETSYELLKDIRQQELNQELVSLLQDFLELCDLVKFAKYFPQNEENDPVIDNATRFVRETMIDISGSAEEKSQDEEIAQNDQINIDEINNNKQEKVTNLEELS